MMREYDREIGMVSLEGSEFSLVIDREGLVRPSRDVVQRSANAGRVAPRTGDAQAQVIG
jgi:hypothetical protein